MKPRIDVENEYVLYFGTPKSISIDPRQYNQQRQLLDVDCVVCASLKITKEHFWNHTQLKAKLETQPILTPLGYVRLVEEFERAFENVWSTTSEYDEWTEDDLE